MRESLRVAFNVDDELERDRLIVRYRNLRATVVQTKHDIEHWNAAHPDAPPFDTTFEDAMLAWCDGTGPFPHPTPEVPDAR